MCNFSYAKTRICHAHTRERRARPRSAVGISAQRCRIFSEDVNNVAGRMTQTAAVYSCVNTSLLCSRPDLLLCRLVCLSVCWCVSCCQILVL